MIAKASPYYGEGSSNPKDTLGTVLKVGRKEATGLYISVMWDDTGLANSYNHLDLQLVSGDNYREALCELIEKKKVLTVDKEFVMQAYESACSSWKAKIEQRFPELFPKEKYARLMQDTLLYGTRLYYKSDASNYTELKYNIALIDGIAGDSREVPKEAKYRGIYVNDPNCELELEVVKVSDGHAIVFKNKN